LELAVATEQRLLQVINNPGEVFGASAQNAHVGKLQRAQLVPLRSII